MKPGTEGRRQNLCAGASRAMLLLSALTPKRVTVPPCLRPCRITAPSPAPGAAPMPHFPGLPEQSSPAASHLMSRHPGRSWRQWLPRQQSRKQLDFSFSPSQSASGGSLHSFSAHGSKAQPQDRADYWHKYRYIYQWI